MNDGFARPHSLANPNATVSPVIYGDDKNLFAEFYDEEIYNKPKSVEAGRAVFDTQVMCRIIFPGDRTKTFVEKVKYASDEFGPSHLERFPRQWAAYKAQQEQVPDGMRLEEWPPMTKARVRELKAMHIHTVEQVAALTDMTGPSIGFDWRQMREMAIATLKPNESLKEITRLHKEVDDLRNQIQSMANAKTSSALSREASEGDRLGRGKKSAPAPDLVDDP